MVLLWSLSGNEAPQVFRTLLGISQKNAVVWMVSTRPLISKSFIIIIIIIVSCECFILAIPDGLSRGFIVTSLFKVSRTLFSILTDRNNAVVWMVSVCLLISSDFTLFPLPIQAKFQVHQLQLASPSPSCSTAFVSSQARYLIRDSSVSNNV